MWNAVSPRKLDKPFGKQYKTLEETLEACVMAKGCTGVNHDGVHYQMCKGTTTSVAVGFTSFRKGGRLVANRGFTWDFRTGYEIDSEYYDSVTYRTVSDAMNKCAGTSDCNGINEEGTNRFRLMAGYQIKKKAGSNCYIQGSKYLLTNIS